jgi:Redoxin
MKSLSPMFVLSALAMGGCGTTNPTPVAADTSVTMDAAITTDTPPPPPPPPPADASTTRKYPAEPYGSEVCQRLEPFTLNRCDGTPYSFVDDGWAEASATVVIISAVWCVPCQNEARVLEAQLVRPYAERGVRVVTILVQNSDRSAITSTQCTNLWQNRYNLTIPVLMDPRQTLSPFYPGLAFPGNLIVDRNGRIRFRQYGSEMGLTSIRNALDAVLAAPDTCSAR